MIDLKTSIEFIEDGIDVSSYTFAIVLAKHKGKWVFVRHRDRSTWELPAGHVEHGETVDEAASRELQEETGAEKFTLEPLVSYKGFLEGKVVYGKIFFAEISILGNLPESEIGEVKCYSEVPGNLTYPHIQSIFIKWYLQNHDANHQRF